MKKSIFALLTFLLMTCFGYAQSVAPAGSTAKAEIKNSTGETIGNATLTEVTEGVRVQVQVSKLTPGKHGIHIHSVGKCEGPDFKSAGPHFNPSNKKHGLENPEGAHAGDLPNLEVGADGTAKQEFIAKGVTLVAGPDSLLKEGGTALVIHAKEDDEKTDPAGNSGDRVGCGVIAS